MPAGRRFETSGEKTLARLEQMLGNFGAEALRLCIAGQSVLEQLSPEAMAPYFNWVEREIQVEPAHARHWEAWPR